ncbi:hypothetical protein BKA70DRAFT_1416046 [Coprinopsis sp. MPI-PUGE-AT-0042]|nr:hypothetical protein BKA70DRAFT_1416046 [Coprinopsis sp. MPI-PUGE-AT-0042]
MPPPADPSSNIAYYPLTLCDDMSQGANLIKSWIIEGLLDVEKVTSALDRVMAKWPMLAGRMEVTGKKRYRIRIPLGPLPADYKAYGFSAQTSTVPLSKYVPLPLLSFSEFPPRNLFASADRIKLGDFKDYDFKDAPLTHWHLTLFKHAGEEYTCIGVHYSHGLLDGVGFSMVMHALEAELASKEWQVPPLPHAGMNENRFQTLIEGEIEKAAPRSEPYLNFTILGLLGILGFLWRSLSQKMWYGIGSYNIIVPYATHTSLVAHTRKTLESADAKGVRVSSGDVVTAWMLKAIYTDGTSPDSIIGLNNVASVRSEWNGELALYPHNCITGLRYPTLTCKEVNILPLHEISHRLAQARSGSRIDDMVASYKCYQEAEKLTIAIPLPQHQKANEHITMSNVSVARICDLDWTPAGGKRVLAHYKMFPHPFPVINILGINGRLDNGDLVLNAELNKRRGQRLEEAFRKLVETFP